MFETVFSDSKDVSLPGVSAVVWLT
jgi:hypothetical protein